MNERLKQRVLLSVVGFNLTVIACQIGSYFYLGSRTFMRDMLGTHTLISLGAGLVVAAIAYFVTPKLQG